MHFFSPSYFDMDFLFLTIKYFFLILKLLNNFKTNTKNTLHVCHFLISSQWMNAAYIL